MRILEGSAPIWAFVWYVYCKAREKRMENPRPGKLERRPDASRSPKWGKPPTYGETRRAWFAIRRAQIWTGHKHLPRRPFR